MQRKDRIDLQGGALLLIFSALLGLNQALVKLVNAAFSPVFQAGLRSACAFLPILLFALIMRRRLTLRDGAFWSGMLVGVFFATEFLLLFLALEWTTVARASVMFYTMPIWVAVGAHFLLPDEAMTLRRALGLALAVAGVVIALSVNAAPATEHAFLGDVFALIGSLFWAAIALTVRLTALSRIPGEMTLLYQLAVSAVILIGLAPLFGPVVRDVTPELLAIFAFQVLAVAAFGFLLWLWMLKVYPASDMTAWSFLAPVFGVLFGWLLLGEPVTWVVLVALALVAAGIMLVSLRPRA